MDVTTPRGASLVVGAVLVPWGAWNRCKSTNDIQTSSVIVLFLLSESGPETCDKCSLRVLGHLRALSSERNRRWFNGLAGLAWILRPGLLVSEAPWFVWTVAELHGTILVTLFMSFADDYQQTSQSARSFCWPGWHCTTSHRGRLDAGIVMQCVTFHDGLLKRVCISGLEHVAT